MSKLDIIFSQKILISYPKNANVLIVDDNGKEYLMECLKGKSHHVVTFRNGEVYAIGIIFALLNKIFKKNSFVGGYLDWVIKNSKPKLVISRLENLTALYFLKARNKTVKFIIIQNGMAGVTFDGKNNEPPDVDYIFTFGEVFTRYFQSRVNAEIIELGSLKNNYYKYTSNTRKKLNVNILSYISQYVPTEQNNITPIKGIRKAKRAQNEIKEITLINNINEWCYRSGVKFQIIGRPGLADVERLYYTNVIKNKFSYVTNDRPGKAYELLDSSHVICSIDSALAYEALSRGCKTAFFSVRSTGAAGDMHSFGGPAGWNVEGPFWTNKHDCESVNKILNYIFNIGEIEWRQYIQDTRYKVVGVDNTDKLHNCIKNIFEIR